MSEDAVSVKAAVQELAARIEKIEKHLAESSSADVTEPQPQDVQFAAPSPHEAAGTMTSSGTQPPVQSPVPVFINGFPPGWQEVMAGSQPFRGLGERELTQSLRALQAALQELPGASDIKLVHLMEAAGKFRVHDAVADSAGFVACRICDGSRTFQAAICAGWEGTDEIQVLFAPGDYAPYNYPAGYRQLIQNVPNQQFQIQAVLAPAVLTLVPDNSPAEYTVRYMLQWK